MRIGILGGSFDPVHQGHLTLARESQKQFKLDKILFIPAFLPPHKTKDASLTSPEVRTRMVEEALAGELSWELCDLELKRSGVSYTVDTLRELKKKYPPPHELFFIAGADSFQHLKTWKEPEEILRLCEWIVAPRSSFKLPSPLPPRVHELSISPMPVSATELRKKINRGEDVSEWIPKKVSDYLKQIHLYREKTK